jgi:cytochrome c553
MKRMILLGAVLTASLVCVSAADVKENWEKSCAKCHGPDGKGDTKMGKKLEVKDFTDAKVQEAMKDEEMLKAIKEGVKDGEKTRMKAAEGLSDDEMKALVKFVREFKK